MKKCPGPQHLNISELAPNSSRHFLENHGPLLLTSPSIFPCAVRKSHPQLCSRLAAVASLCSARIPRGLSRACWVILLYSLDFLPQLLLIHAHPKVSVPNTEEHIIPATPRGHTYHYGPRRILYQATLSHHTLLTTKETNRKQETKHP